MRAELPRPWLLEPGDDDYLRLAAGLFELLGERFAPGEPGRSHRDLEQSEHYRRWVQATRWSDGPRSLELSLECSSSGRDGGVERTQILVGGLPGGVTLAIDPQVFLGSLEAAGDEQAQRRALDALPLAYASLLARLLRASSHVTMGPLDPALSGDEPLLPVGHGFGLDHRIFFFRQRGRTSAVACNGLAGFRETRVLPVYPLGLVAAEAPFCAAASWYGRPEVAPLSREEALSWLPGAGPLETELDHPIVAPETCGNLTDDYRFGWGRHALRHRAGRWFLRELITSCRVDDEHGKPRPGLDLAAQTADGSPFLLLARGQVFSHSKLPFVRGLQVAIAGAEAGAKEKLGAIRERVERQGWSSEYPR